MIENARSSTRLAGLGVLTAGWVGIAAVHQSLVAEEKRARVFQRYLPYWARSLVRSCGGEVTLTPDSVVPAHTRARLIVSNHRSPFDIGVLLGIFGGQALSRADLEGWPVLGLAARRAGTIFVDRKNAGSGASAIRAIRQRLRSGASILLFPEGSTFAGDEVQPFKPGAFSAMRGLEVEILPVGLAYDHGAEFVDETFVEHVLRVTKRPRTRCVVQIGTPRIASGRAAEIATGMHEEVQELVDRARAHWLTLQPQT